jgi:hypothetical protein
VRGVPVTQLQLPREPIVLDEVTIRAPKDIIKAFTMAADLGGLDDGQAAAAAGMDPSTWSQFKTGARGIKPLEFNGYLDQCGNNLPLAYWAYTRGFDLTPRESELERQLRVERERTADLQKENAVLRSLFHRTT